MLFMKIALVWMCFKLCLQKFGIIVNIITYDKIKEKESDPTGRLEV